MREAVIVDAIRSPMGRGKPGGALSELHPADLLGQVFTALFERTGVDSSLVEDVIVGCVTQVREQSACIGRWSWLAAGFSEETPSTTVDRRCGSGQQALHFAAQAVMAGVHEIVVAGGVESMSRVPILSNRLDADPFGQSVSDRYAPGLVSQGTAAELVATRAGFDRAALDEYSVRSQSLASRVAAEGRFAPEIAAIDVPEGESAAVTVSADETIRPNTSMERLGALRSAFFNEDDSSRFPDIGWHVTAGNSSQLADGAGAALVMSAEKAAELGLRPRARFTGFSLAGSDPVEMLTAPIPATRKLLASSGVAIEEIEHFEVNEAFASVPLLWQSELGVPLEKINPRGGAIALGHPLGASGIRLLTSMLAGLEESDGRYGLQVMCEAGGMANALLIERLERE